MKFGVLLFLLPAVLGYIEDYKGFNACGFGGWDCYKDDGFDVVYRCNSTKDSSARVWAWTARIPSNTKTLTFENCYHLEVHLDCTKGLRSYTLKELRIKNVTKLEFLDPLAPGIFLHDNDKVLHSPPSIHLEDIESTNFHPEMFNRPGGGCRYKMIKLKSIEMKNVNVDFEKGIFDNSDMDKFVLTNVVVKSIASNAINIASNVTITGSKFPEIPQNGIYIKGKNVTFTNNTIEKLSTTGLTALTKHFTFNGNTVTEIEQYGMDILGTYIQINENHWHHLGNGAFEKISPGYTPQEYEGAAKLTYEFSHNKIDNLNPGSMHVNWGAYQNVCSQITLKNNVFDCSCMNLGWLSYINGLGPKIQKFTGFYQYFLNDEGTNNMCLKDTTCSIMNVVSKIKDICDNKTQLEDVCILDERVPTTILPETTTPEIPETTTPEIPETTAPEIPETTTSEAEILSYVVTNEINLHPVQKSYVENQTKEVVTKSSTWVIVAVLIIAIAAISSSVSFYVFWMKRKRQCRIARTLYQNDRGADLDNLVTEIDHHHHMFD